MLGDGDAVFFNAEAVHSYERVGDESCTALILTMPEALLGNHSGSKLALGKKKLGRGVPPPLSLSGSNSFVLLGLEGDVAFQPHDNKGVTAKNRI
jgi:hypothetical protein